MKKLRLPTQNKKQRRRKERAARVHDRRALATENTNVRFLVVDDPWELGGKITVAQSLRDDPLARLFKREQIDPAQYAACREYQRLCERAELVPVKAMDPTKEPVDGGGSIPDPFTEGKRKAIRELIHLHAKLGQEGTALIRAVLIQRLFFSQITEIRDGGIADRRVNYFGERFRECAEMLAVELGYAPKRVSKTKGWKERHRGFQQTT